MTHWADEYPEFLPIPLALTVGTLCLFLYAVLGDTSKPKGGDYLDHTGNDAVTGEQTHTWL